MILKEFDKNKNAIINSWDLIEKIEGFPEIVISCFAKETFNRIIKKYKVKQIAKTGLANIEIPIYEGEYSGIKIGFMNSPVGAPACVGMLEDLLAYGMKKLILFGTCGMLDHNIEDVSIIIPDSAIRDEGTSYHYAEASDEIGVNKDTLGQFVKYLDNLGISHTQGKVWTTDAMYRETIDKLNKRKEQGCIVVDMECSSVAAWAQFRDIKVLHFFYAADKLSKEGWDIGTLSNHSELERKDLIAELAVGFAKYI